MGLKNNDFYREKKTEKKNKKKQSPKIAILRAVEAREKFELNILTLFSSLSET